MKRPRKKKGPAKQTPRTTDRVTCVCCDNPLGKYPYCDKCVIVDRGMENHMKREMAEKDDRIAFLEGRLVEAEHAVVRSATTMKKALEVGSKQLQIEAKENKKISGTETKGEAHGPRKL